MRVCIVGASGKLGTHMVGHALERGHEVVAVCREQSVAKLAEFDDRITVVPGATDDRDVIQRAVAGADGVLVVLVPRGRAPLRVGDGAGRARPRRARSTARVLLRLAHHARRPGRLHLEAQGAGERRRRLARLVRFADLDDQVKATRRIFASDTRWTVVRGSKLEEGVSEGLPVWSRHVGDPVLQSDITRRVDFALFMVHALENEDLVREAPAIVSSHSTSALAHTRT